MKHKHRWLPITKDLIKCVECNKISILNKSQPRKNGCFGKVKRLNRG
jgi:hypothetical protein